MPIPALRRAMESRPSDRDKKDVEALIISFFEVGKSKDLTVLADFHSARESFTKFDENPPYTRQNSDEAFVHEQAAFANISDYSYRVDDLRVDLLGGTAIATFYLTYRGMFVNDYSFEGSPVGSRARVTMVLTKTDRGWKIAHEHLSRFPDWASKSESEK
jgi:ketosteroid isomerase-like protein